MPSRSHRAVGACALLLSAAGAYAEPVYTVRDLGVLDGFDYAVQDNAAGQCLNEAGQAIFDCVRVIEQGDPSTGTLPNIVVVAVRYTPGVGLERVAGSFEQNTVRPIYINDAGQVFGLAFQRTWSYNASNFTVVQASQHALWIQPPGSGTAQTLAVPAFVSESFVYTLGSDSMFSNAGVVALETLRRPSPGVFLIDAGTYGPSGWTDSRSLHPQIESADWVSLSAIGDAGDVIGSTSDPHLGFWHRGGQTELTSGVTPRSVRDDGSLMAGDYGTSSGAHIFVKRWGEPLQDIHDPTIGHESYAGNLSGPFLNGMYFDINGRSVAAFRWDSRDGTTRSLPMAQFSESMGVFGLNASGVVIGSDWLDLDATSPWVWNPDEGPSAERRYLRDAIGDPHEETWELNHAIDINNAGQILAYGKRRSDGKLRVVLLEPIPTVTCRADFDTTNGVQVADIFAFLRAWFANSPSADFDAQNGIQVADIFAFLRAWFAGC